MKQMVAASGSSCPCWQTRISHFGPIECVRLHRPQLLLLLSPCRRLGGAPSPPQLAQLLLCARMSHCVSLSSYLTRVSASSARGPHLALDHLSLPSQYTLTRLPTAALSYWNSRSPSPPAAPCRRAFARRDSSRSRLPLAGPATNVAGAFLAPAAPSTPRLNVFGRLGQLHLRLLAGGAGSARSGRV